MNKGRSRFSLPAKLLVFCVMTTLSIFFSGCKQVEPETQTSFDTVTSQLDSNGSFYMYADTRQIMDQLIEEKKNTSMLVKSIFKDQQTADLAAQVFNLAMTTFINSGIPQTDGVGMSSIKFNDNLYRCRFIAHKSPDAKPETVIWKVFGKSPHDLKSLEMLPENTALASFFDFDSVMAGKMISKELRASRIEDLLTSKNKAIRAFVKYTGMSPLALCRKLNGHFGIFLTLNKDKTFMLPIDGKLEKFPEITFNIVISVKDATLFDLILSKLPATMNPQEKTESGIRMVVMNQIPLMLKVQPAIGQKDGFLVISSQPEAIKAFFNPSGKNKLVQTDSFKRLSENISLTGNGFKYSSAELSDLMSKMQQFFLSVAKMQNPSGATPSSNYGVFLSKLYRDVEVFSVYQCNPDGIAVTANSNMNLPGLMALNLTISPIIYSMMLMEPAIQKASNAGKEVQCVQNMKQISLGLLMYAVDHNDKFPEPGITGLNKIYKLYQLNPQVFVCPSTNAVPAAQGTPLTSENVSYIYLGYDEPIMKIRYPSRIPLAFDKPGNHKDFVTVLFADGHVRQVKGDFKTCADVIWTLSRDLPEGTRNSLLKRASKLDNNTE